MTEAQRAVAERVLDAEGEDREHLVVHLSGAHAYGFASIDSDLDLKAVHIEPIETVVGLQSASATRNRLEVIDGVEIDYTSNPLVAALHGALGGDGNMLERLLNPDPLRGHPSLDTLRPVITQNLSRKVHRHYRGFANNQRRAVQAADPPAAKRVLYVLRTTLTGVHLLETGQCVPDLTALCDTYGFEIVHPLVEVKRAAEVGGLPPDLARQVPQTLDRAAARLDQALQASPLPEQPPAVGALEQWLIDLRRQQLAALQVSSR